MPYDFKLERRVQFAETDMAGIVHFSNFFRYMEETEHAFFRSLGLYLHTPAGTSDVQEGWVRVEADCRYRNPLRYPDEFEVHALVRERGRASLSYDFRFRRPGVEIATGRLKVVHVEKGPGDEAFRATAIPAEVAALVEVAPPEVLQEDD
ncbi:MAG: thioesterase family protein [Planctomycetota bacterium]